MKKVLLKGLTKEQLEKARACKTNQELLEFIKEEGVELDEDQLEMVAGGWGEEDERCPYCGSTNVFFEESSDENEYSRGIVRYCSHCRRPF